MVILEDYITYQGKNCILGSLCNIARYLGVELTEADLFFRYCSFCGSSTIGQEYEELLEEKGSMPMWDFVRAKLTAGMPVMVSITPEVLPHITSSAGDSSVMHYLNITAIDTENGRAFISDCYVPTFEPSTYEGWVDYTDFAEDTIGNCWSIKESALKRICEEGITYETVQSRIKYFLGHEADGIGILKLYRDHFCNRFEAQDYDGIYVMLAGLRMKVINPLEYLKQILKSMGEVSDEELDDLDVLISGHWEKMNFKLIKCAVAHRSLATEKLTAAANEAIALEKKVLNDILCWLDN